MSGQDTLSQAEIDALLAAVASDPKDATDDPGQSAQRRIQNMDFRRPSKFNKDQLHTLEMLHDTFSRLGATYLSGALRCIADITVLGPAPAPLSLLRGRHRRRLLLKTGRERNVQSILRDWLAPLSLPTNVRLTIDIDPYSFM